MNEANTRPRLVRLAIWTIVAHAVISTLHGAAHQSLAVKLTVLQSLFIAIVITIGPILAGVLLWKGILKIGGIILACSMTGSLAFGVYNHFVAISPDHVLHLANTTNKNWVWIFQATAVLVALTEAIGSWIAFRLLSQSKLNS